ncbi:MAG: hypothetical protein IPO29_11480 [Anaerolineae bacterium]|nr:hypothetical protein [Anaerolineae bacterium]
MNTPPPGAGNTRRRRSSGFTDSAPIRRRAKVRVKLTPLGLLAALLAVGGLLLLVTRCCPPCWRPGPLSP